jgi:hypothetical protein
MEFEESVDTDVLMIDQIGFQNGLDPCTGEVIGAKGGNPNVLILDQLERAVKLIPDGRGMQCETQCDWLIDEWNQMLE